MLFGVVAVVPETIPLKRSDSGRRAVRNTSGEG